MLLVLVTLAMALPGAAAAQEESNPLIPSGAPMVPDRVPNGGVVPGQIIVKYEEGTSPAEEATLRRQEDLKKKEDLDLINADVVRVEGQSTQATLRDLNSRPDVEYAEPDLLTAPAGYSDEPFFGALWGLNNTGQTIQGQAGVRDVDIDALEASTVTQGDPNQAPPPGNALTSADLATLTDFLGGGGKLVLTGRQFMDNIWDLPFVTHTLDLHVCPNFPTQLSAGGTFSGSAGTSFAGESYSIPTDPSTHDVLSPNDSPFVVSQGIYPNPTPSLPQPANAQFLDGTSMAAPQVAGVAALAASVKPSLLSDPVALKKVVMGTGKPASATVGKTVTGDIVDADAAIDLSAPTVLKVSPIGKKVQPTAKPTVTFSKPMDKDTIDRSTFTLRKGTTQIPVKTVNLDSTGTKAILAPSKSLKRGATYTATITTAAKDPMGTALVEGRTWSFKVRR
ncbi:MAG: Ig-like domain-containing protein [Actinobacteria bacterium]|nr:Ig-like domain-containing protein [Actinomycetota bacterium]